MYFEKFLIHVVGQGSERWPNDLAHGLRLHLICGLGRHRDDGFICKFRFMKIQVNVPTPKIRTHVSYVSKRNFLHNTPQYSAKR